MFLYNRLTEQKVWKSDWENQKRPWLRGQEPASYNVPRPDININIHIHQPVRHQVPVDTDQVEHLRHEDTVNILKHKTQIDLKKISFSKFITNGEVKFSALGSPDRFSIHAPEMKKLRDWYTRKLKNFTKKFKCIHCKFSKIDDLLM